MHAAAYDFVAEHAIPQPCRVLEIGSRNVNGSVRPLFSSCEYVGLDVREGEGVDVVADVCEYKANKFDVVVCCEVLEHAKNWRDLIDAADRLIKKGGTLILTAAGPGRAPHSAFDGAELRAGEHYANIAPKELEAALKGWAKVEVDVLGTDVRAVAVK